MSRRNSDPKGLTESDRVYRNLLVRLLIKLVLQSDTFDDFKNAVQKLATQLSEESNEHLRSFRERVEVIPT